MATTSVVICDVEGCGKVKKDVNHWFKLGITESGMFRCYPFSFSQNDLCAKDVCGAEHAMLMFSRYLSHKTLNPANPTVEANVT